METKRKRIMFHTLAEVKDFLTEFLAEQRRASLNNELMHLREDLNSIILAGGNYL
jgi:hypothetical protein